MARARRAAGSERAQRAAWDLVLEVELLEVVTLLAAAVAPDGRDVEHAVTKLDECATLDGDVEVGNVVQDEVDQRLDLRVAQVLEEGRLFHELPLLVSGQPVLRKEKVETVEAVGAQLLLLLLQVRATHHANEHALAQPLKEIQSLLGRLLARLRQRAVHVKEADDVGTLRTGAREREVRVTPGL